MTPPVRSVTQPVPGGPWPPSGGAHAASRQDPPGWIGLATVVWTTVALLLVLAPLSAAADVLSARARAQTAADAAVLAALGASPLSTLSPVTGASPLTAGAPSPHARARTAAAGNGAEVLSCDCADPVEASVEVGVAPGLRWVRAALPVVRARARAVLAPR